LIGFGTGVAAGYPAVYASRLCISFFPCKIPYCLIDNYYLPCSTPGTGGPVNKKEALLYFNQGMKFLHAEKLNEALDFFTRAIELDPNHTESYKNRGEIYTMLGRIVEGNADLEKAKFLRSGKAGGSGNEVKVKKFDMKSVENVYDDVFAATSSGSDDLMDFDDQIYDYVFSDETLESDDLWDSLADEQSDKMGFPAIFEYLDGRREEVSRAVLFQPSSDEITLIQEDGNKNRIVALEQLSCMRMAGLPTQYSKKKDSRCHVEIIETLDGNIYHESIHPAQDMKNVLLGFSTKEGTPFKYTLIPLINIKKRYQRRFLGEILLEKRFIAGDVLKSALEEHQQLRKMKFGKIIAKHAHILYSAVEVEIQKAYEANKKGLKIGEILLDAGLVNEEQILEALDHQEKMQNTKIGQFLIEKGIIQEKEVYMALAEKFRIPFVDLRLQKVSKKILSLLPDTIIQRYKVLPIAVKETSLVVATVRPDPSAICEIVLKQSPMKDIEFVLAQPSHLRNVIRMLYQKK